MRGPEHVFELANASYRMLVNHRDVIGRSVADALPEVVDQGFVRLLDDVYREGKAHVGRRVPIALRGGDGKLRESLLDFVYQPILNDAGDVSAIFVQGSDVTEHVRTETHLKLVNDELKHRVKNTLAMVSSIASQTLRGEGNDVALQKFHQRLATFGKAHDILTASAWATAEIETVLRTALAPHVNDAKRLSFSGPPITLGAKQALSLSLALHELATNASKFGALSTDDGRIEARWEIVGDKAKRFRFLWHETGGPPVVAPTRRGFGSRLIERVLGADFGGEVEIDYLPEGVRLTLTAPIESLGNLLPSPFVEMDGGQLS